MSTRGRAADGGGARVITRVIGKQPIGTAFVTPYVVFLAAVFAYPLGFAV
ncbi:hypothetical protein [Kribbella monticola]|nr:hypothetical protein [Kribbella monticola]